MNRYSVYNEEKRLKKERYKKAWQLFIRQAERIRREPEEMPSAVQGWNGQTHSALYGAFRLPNALCQRDKTVNPTCHVGKFEVNPTYCVLLKRLVLSYDFIAERKHRLLAVIRFPYKGQKEKRCKLSQPSAANKEPTSISRKRPMHLDN